MTAAVMEGQEIDVFGRSLGWFVATALAACVAPLFAAASLRSGIWSGVACAAVGSAVGLALLHLVGSKNPTTQKVLGALVATFLLRMMLVAAGILVAHALKADLAAFCAGFFGLYLVHQVIEIVVIARRARSTESKA